VTGTAYVGDVGTNVPAAIARVRDTADKYRDARAARLDAISDALYNGASITDIANAVGLTRAAIYKMVERGKV
jgi:hypothetical protein